MEELDLLKKDWNKKDSFPKVSEEKIYGMLHKNSSSTVKWIFIISLIELGLGFVLNFGLSFTKYDQKNIEFLKQLGVYDYYNIFMLILYVVIGYFIIRFYSMYKKVSTTDNTKSLMHTILKTRKVVKNYILFNLLTAATLFILIFSYGIIKGIQDVSNGVEVSMTTYIVAIFVAVLVTGIVTGILWTVYNLIYGRLVRRLNKNYNELKKIDL